MMKNKNLLIGLCSVPLLLSISTSMTAQDLRERTYYYEILEPRHEPKPEIKGFATERIKENILATPVHLKMWQHSKKPEGALVTFTEREQRLLDALKEKEKLSLNQCCKLCRLNHKTTCELLADFIRFGLVELVFHGHKFYFKLNKE